MLGLGPDLEVGFESGVGVRFWLESRVPDKSRGWASFGSRVLGQESKSGFDLKIESLVGC